MKSMRAPVTASLQRKPRLPLEGLLCSFPHRPCSQERLDGHDYCLRHILEDKTAPFKQCNYISNKTGKRCGNAAPKTERKDGYCQDHASRASAIRQRAHRKRRPRESAESLLSSIEHYVSHGNKNNGGVAGGNNGGLEPRRLRGADSVANRALEYATSSDSESECPLVDQAWRGDCDSDADSMDSEQDDPLRHAGIYTAEEVALIARDKLIRLQSLYIDQFKRLQHLMREKRRRYLSHTRTERDTFGGVQGGEEGPRLRDKYQRLLATNRYHRRFGKEALVHRQSKERRISSSEGLNYKPPSFVKCIHQSEGAGSPKCAARAVPLSKFCLQHIQHDPHQVLYKSCDFGGVCTRPVAKLFPHSACPLHTALGRLEQRYPRPVEPEETDDDDLEDDLEMKDEVSIDVVGGSPGVKFELPMDTDQDTDGQSVPHNLMEEDNATPPLQPPADLDTEAKVKQEVEEVKKTPKSKVKEESVSEVKVGSEVKDESEVKAGWVSEVQNKSPEESSALSTSTITDSTLADQAENVEDPSPSEKEGVALGKSPGGNEASHQDKEDPSQTD